MDISIKSETFSDTPALYEVIHEAHNNASTIIQEVTTMENNNNKVYGYARVSSREQNLDRQMEALLPFVNDPRDLIVDKASGKDFNRSGYSSLKNSLLRRGDTLVIKELDRLGREYEGLKREWNELIGNAKAKNVPFGRPKVEVPNNFTQVYQLWKSNEITAVEAMRRLNLKRSTFYNLVQLHEVENKVSC